MNMMIVNNHSKRGKQTKRIVGVPAAHSMTMSTTMSTKCPVRYFSSWQKLIFGCLLVIIVVNLFLGHHIISRHDPDSSSSSGHSNQNMNHITTGLVSSPQSLISGSSSSPDDGRNSGKPIPSTADTSPKERRSNHDIKNDVDRSAFKQSVKSYLSVPSLQHEEQKLLSKMARDAASSYTNMDLTCHALKENYKGILHIAMGDIGGGASTIFFQFVIGQLIYAEQYRLLPVIHFNNVSNIIYDQDVHGAGPSYAVTFYQGTGTATDIVRPNGHWRDRIPGPPKFNRSTAPTVVQFEGTGVWNDYFLPVVPSLDLTNPDNRLLLQNCARELPYVTLTLKQITPGIHGFAPWAPKCWRYHYLPDYITKPHWPLHEWLRPSRLLGNAAVQRYQIEFQPYIVQAAEQANPHCSTPSTTSTNSKNRCLGLHIRHSDKAAGRRQVPVQEFLPFVQAFVHAGGKFIYLATDSTLVLQEIAETWPANIRSRISSLGDAASDNDNNHGVSNSAGGTRPKIVRSNNDQAVFDIAASHHHTTNVQALIEIKALSLCRFMVHGLSALSESALWLNHELQSTSVDLENPDHIDPSQFGTLVQMVLRGDHDNDPRYLPKPPPSSKWWKTRQPVMGGAGGIGTRHDNALAVGQQPLSCVLGGYKGIFRISSTGGDRINMGMGIFIHILNQIIYAEKHNWLPWIHLEPDHENSVLYDRWAHYGGYNNVTVGFKAQFTIRMGNSGFPGAPVEVFHNGEQRQDGVVLSLDGNGLWESYFDPVPGFDTQKDDSCRDLPITTMSDSLVVALTSQAPWAVRAWKYKTVPEHLLIPGNISWKDLFAPFRKRANTVIQKYYRFRSYLLDRAEAVNPVKKHEVCVSVHMRSANDYIDYLQEFVQAGGSFIYVATDSSRVLRYIAKNFAPSIVSLIRTQGDQVVRTSKEWPLHMMDNHHRVNGEALVDVLAMSKCQFLLHTSTTQAEAAIYLNLNLHNNSVNLDDPDRISPSKFGVMVKQLVYETGLPTKASTQQINFAKPPSQGRLVEYKLDNATIVRRDTSRRCRNNALVYLAQKKHSSYTGKDSYSSFLRSLDLIYKNYLSLNNHLDNLDLFIFHTNDFTHDDFRALESRLGPSLFGVIRLVNLTGSPFWQRPPHQTFDDPHSWYAYPLFSEGYRRMMHWFAIDIWNFFARLNDEAGCSYRYIFRLDEDSLIHSPIQYDVFDFMEANRYVYGYRMCAYEMQVTRRMWTLFKKQNHNFQPQRDVDLQMCGFYNNFFVADLEFFRSLSVQTFLRFIDRQGHIYRRRLGDLMIHSMSVYAFADPNRIHRFLDFTYEHGTFNQTNRCLAWGGIQAGYNDKNSTTTLSEFYHDKLLDRGCFANATMMRPEDLSPSYAHISDGYEGTLSLYTITAGRVEFPLGKGILSG